MDKHIHTIIAGYVLIYAFAVTSALHYMQHNEIMLSYPNPLLLIAAIGLYFKKSAAAHVTFGIYVISMIMGAIVVFLTVIHQTLEATSPKGNGFTEEHTALMILYIPIAIAIGISLYLPVKILNSKSAKTCFGINSTRGTS